MLKMIKISLIQIILTIEVALTDFNITVLHTNDVHSRIEELNAFGGRCEDESITLKKCFGGVARRHTMIKKIRKNSINTILLDGGDQFQGTSWFGIYRGIEAATFMNHDNYDAMTLGNHEFDNGVEGIIPFIINVTFSILSANMDVSNVTDWPKNSTFAKSKVFQRNGVKIGVIGYITPDTKWLSRPGPNITFYNVIESVRKEAHNLESKGVKVIIALGHAGFETDIMVAREVKELDVVVGGHTNTFLYTGKPPSIEPADGPYPYVFNRSDGSKVLIVQAFTFGKYLGKLDIVFNDNGVATTWSGNPILLDHSVPEDPLVKEMVEKMKKKMKDRLIPIGTTLVYLNGVKPLCRIQDCNLGNLVADAVMKLNISSNGITFETPDASIWNAGGLRSSISKKRNETITLEDIYTVLPFGNTAQIALIPGDVLKKVFEWSVSGLNEYAGRYLQVSGIRMRYNSKMPVDKRIIELLISCRKCSSGYEPVDDKKIYKIVAPNYILEGGDGYEMLKSVSKLDGGQDVVDLVTSYIKEISPVNVQSEGRSLEQTFKINFASSMRPYLASLFFNVIVLHLFM
ncbi:snake venom 5'-nucleotidase isoform X5 [Hydra vulgaris]|uniref:5'-nucleotidase n=2 Tax=Hydra vulgaris TaxID=6087 RepID=A0ABM4D9T0_HYDVU